MPIYEYHCSKCGDFETMQRMSDKPLTTCPTCRRKVTKLISSTTFHLKGSGWYITDYARKGEGTGNKADKKSDDKKADGATATSETTSSTESASSDAAPKASKSTDKGSKGKKPKAAVA
jgi:putative FmdB family regulatory protein